MSKLKDIYRQSLNKIDFALWCESCMDWKTEFGVDESGLWILCNDCDEGLVKVITHETKDT